MKRLILSLCLLALLIPSMVFAVAGTVTQTGAEVSDNMRTITFTCTGGTLGDAGTVPDTAVSAANSTWIAGWYLTNVEAYPSASGVTPDAASVFILQGSPAVDLLGSEDNGTTAYNGLNLIDGVYHRATIPDLYIPRAGAHQPYFWPITGALTLRVKDQATASAIWYIRLTFTK